MGAFSPPWPQTLIEPVEYEAFWRVPGPQKAKSQLIPHILGKKRKWGFYALLPKMMILVVFRFLVSRDPQKGFIFHRFDKGLRPWGRKGTHFTKMGLI